MRQGIIGDSTSTPKQEEVIDNIGEAFIEWAEKYWGFKRHYTQEPNDNCESAPYEFVKEAFTNKINELIRNKYEN